MKKSRTQLQMEEPSPSILSFVTIVCGIIVFSAEVKSTKSSPALQMSEGSVYLRRDGVIRGYVPAVGVLMQVHVALYMGQDRLLKALCDYRSEGNWPILIQACHCGAFGDGDDGGRLHAGGNSCPSAPQRADVHRSSVPVPVCYPDQQLCEG